LYQGATLIEHPSQNETTLDHTEWKETGRVRGTLDPSDTSVSQAFVYEYTAPRRRIRVVRIGLMERHLAQGPYKSIGARRWSGRPPANDKVARNMLPAKSEGG